MKKLKLALATSVLLSTSIFAEGYVASYKETGKVVNNVAGIIVDNYNYLEAKSKALLDAVQVLQKDPNTANLRKAQAAWRESRIGFEISEAHLFGPVVSLLIDPALDSWPLDTEQLVLSADIVKGLKADDIEKFVASLNHDVTGFHAVEYLLFGRENSRKIEELNAAELSYLVLLTQIINDKSVELRTAWTEKNEEEGLPAYQQLLTTSDKGNEVYASQKAAIEEYVAGMITIIDEVGTGKLIDPLGDSVASANPMLVESQYSWNSTTDFFWDMAGVWEVWHGKSVLSNNEGPGIRDIVVAKDKALAEQIDSEINKVLETIVAISYSQYENGSGAILKAKGDIINLASLIAQDEAEEAFRSQISSVSGRKRIAKAEAALDALSKSLTEKVLPEL